MGLLVVEVVGSESLGIGPREFDRLIIGWCGKSLSENGLLCVHVTGYKRGYKLWHIIQDGIWYKLGYKQ